MEATVAESTEQWASAAASIATVLALLVGAWWTYSRFFKHRTGKPRAALSYVISHRRITHDDLLVRILINVENTGSVLLPIRELRCEICQVVPPAPETLQLLEEQKLIPQDATEADLPCIGRHKDSWEKGKVEIEPGEADSFPYDFVVPADVATVLIYAHIPNNKKKVGIGWDISSLYDLLPQQMPGSGRQQGVDGELDD